MGKFGEYRCQIFNILKHYTCIVQTYLSVIYKLFVSLNHFKFQSNLSNSFIWSDGQTEIDRQCLVDILIKTSEVK